MKSSRSNIKRIKDLSKDELLHFVKINIDGLDEDEKAGCVLCVKKTDVVDKYYICDKCDQSMIESEYIINGK